jgi:type I restriction enzyme R subunit
MGDKNLRVIAHELLVSVRGQPFRRLDAPRGGAGRLRVLVKRILRKHGYPPDLQEAAVQTVIQQAEGLSARWAA